MSLFPEVDEEIKQKRKEYKQRIKELVKDTERYRPSNGTEGDIFYSNFCHSCGKDNPEKEKYCNTYFDLLHGETAEVRKTEKGKVFCINDLNFNIADFDTKSNTNKK